MANVAVKISVQGHLFPERPIPTAMTRRNHWLVSKHPGIGPKYRLVYVNLSDVIAVARLDFESNQSVVSWLGRRTCDREIASSTPGRCIAR